MSAIAEDSNQGTIPWWLVLIEGISLVIFGIFFLARPGMTTLFLVQLLGIYWILSGIFSIARIFVDRTAWGGKLFLGIIGIVAGILVVGSPLWSAFIIVNTAIILLGFTGIIIGIVNVVQAIRGEGWGVGLLGAASIILGLILLDNRRILTIALPTTLGILALLGGIVAIIAAFRQRSEENRRVEAAVAAYNAPAETAQVEVAAASEKVAQDAGVEEAVAASEEVAEKAAAPTQDAGVEEEPSAAAPAMAPAQDAGEEGAEMPDTPGEKAKFHQDLTFVEGIGAAYSKSLADAGVVTTHDLLETGSTRKGRNDLAEQTGISHKLITTWVNHVDLYRVPGVGAQYADLLEAAGVDTVPELAQRNPDNLFNKMVEVNQEKKLVREVPGQHQVEDWVTQAKELPRKITY
jgi:uncharacterized membrane protein HdeD (DUF308 family)/predicted flap endonuclease-1-like 5' DNA nuclease